MGSGVRRDLRSPTPDGRAHEVQHRRLVDGLRNGSDALSSYLDRIWGGHDLHRRHRVGIVAWVGEASTETARERSKRIVVRATRRDAARETRNAALGADTGRTRSRKWAKAPA